MKEIILSAVLALPTAAWSQSSNTAQEGWTSGWQGADNVTSQASGDPAGNSGDSVTSGTMNGNPCYVVWINGDAIFRVAKDDVSLSQGEKDAFDEAIAQSDGVDVWIGDQDGDPNNGVQPIVTDVVHVP